MFYTFKFKKKKAKRYYKMDKLIFTGGTGFLGKNVMPFLKDKALR